MIRINACKNSIDMRSQKNPKYDVIIIQRLKLAVKYIFSYNNKGQQKMQFRKHILIYLLKCGTKATLLSSGFGETNFNKINIFIKILFSNSYRTFTLIFSGCSLLR